MEKMDIPHLAVISSKRTERDDNNPLVLQTSDNKYWLIDVDKTIKSIDKELKAVQFLGELQNFKDGLTYSGYLRKLRAYLQVAKVLHGSEHSN